MKKEKIVFVMALITIIISSIISVYAANYLYNSTEVEYDNQGKNITSTNVQGAIDELYTDANNYSSINTRVTNLESSFSLRGTLEPLIGSNLGCYYGKGTILSLDKSVYNYKFIVVRSGYDTGDANKGGGANLTYIPTNLINGNDNSQHLITSYLNGYVTYTTLSFATNKATIKYEYTAITSIVTNPDSSSIVCIRQIYGMN